MFDKLTNGICLLITGMGAIGYAILVIYGIAFLMGIAWAVLQVVLSFFR